MNKFVSKYTFSDAKFMDARQKELTLKMWIRFIDSGFSERDFTKRLYDHLTLHCTFIAHYNRHEFYYTYFNNVMSAIKFFNQFDTEINPYHNSVELGMNIWYTNSEYNDINSAMCDYVTENRDTLYSNIEKLVNNTSKGVYL